MKKRSISIHGHRTSLLLEEIFWKQLEEIAAQKNLTLPALVTYVDRQRIKLSGDTAGPAQVQPQSLASALRTYVVKTLIDAKN